MKLRDIAYARQGDKTDVANICVFPHDEADWPALRERLTAEVVATKFAPLIHGTVTRYEFPVLHGLNFVMTAALAGGMSRSLRVDGTGKSYASLMLDIDL
ncbi:hypothetical protein [Pseudofrankia asymbiotica]|uniref:AtuA-like ferredoxin-fold domain-containing protein n=1 Tax=Pseudofrankia asymbiotica TaxID=1834516 RepID=A0A1V2I9P9_9ACTN|nr:hypothetical protein [Pseudofrankia asymbiotica]ONH28023.1 hypothetical protein BL253_20685 [Pseudofrankia asymbiotica]